MGHFYTFILLSIILCFGKISAQSVLCPSAIATSMTKHDSNFEAVDGNAASAFTTCVPISDNAVLDTTASPAQIVMGISSDGCPDLCANRPYKCALFESSAQTFYGTYTCTLKAANTAGTLSSCYFAAGQGTEYQEIYMRFLGTNNTKLHIGFVSNGIAYPDTTIGLTFQSDQDFHTYSFIYDYQFIAFYVDGVSVLRVTPSYPGQYSMPDTAGLFMVKYVTSSGNAADMKALGIYDGTPTTIAFTNLTYVPASCSNNTFESSSSEAAGSSSDSNLPSWARSCTLTRPLIIYGDSLGKGWTDTSIGQRNLKSTTPLHNGTYAMSWNVEENANLALSSENAISIADYWAIEMWVNGGSLGAQQVTVHLSSAGSDLGFVNLGDYTGTIGVPAWTWMRIQIPLADFKIQDTYESFDSMFFTPAFDGFMGILSFDDIKLTNGEHCLGKTIDIFTDTLNSKWNDESYGSNDLTNTLFVASGDVSIKFRMFEGGAIQFHTDAGFSTNDWVGFQFKMNNQGIPNPKINVGVLQDNNAGASMSLSYYYGGVFPFSDSLTDQYVTVTVFFNDLGVYPGTKLDGIIIKSGVNDYQGDLYIDDLKLVALQPDPKDSSDSSSGNRIQIVSFFTFFVIGFLSLFL